MNQLSAISFQRPAETGNGKLTAESWVLKAI
jgi:hypothetical protein